MGHARFGALCLLGISLEDTGGQGSLAGANGTVLERLRGKVQSFAGLTCPAAH